MLTFTTVLMDYMPVEEQSAQHFYFVLPLGHLRTLRQIIVVYYCVWMLGIVVYVVAYMTVFKTNFHFM